MAKKCKCDFCRKNAGLDKALDSNDIGYVKDVLRYFANEWLCVAEDLNYYQCLIDGIWPNSDEIIARKRSIK